MNASDAKDSGIDTWTGMRVFELLNIPGLTCHEGAWQALSDEQRARCESIARAINRNSAPRSGLSTGEPAPINRDFAATKEDPVPGSDESKQNIPDRFDAAGFEWLQNEILNDLQRRVDTSPELEMKQAFRRAGSDVARTFALMRRAIHLTPIDDLATRQATHIARAGRESGHEQP